MKCQRCYKGMIFLAPDLYPSGYSPESGRDLKCNICGTHYSSRTGKEFDKESYFKQQERKKAIKDYNNYWFNNSCQN